ncbi:hypothetical protein [Pandoraea sp. NPDC087047]|uniref:Dph6-related ATP pyrophosphatase n=1 Tax=Pandoraea sp. NPDC087047 TaxID=3364390 RepID=UPI00382E3DA0
MPTHAFFSWSGGKDSCLALHHALSCDTSGAPHFDVRRLLAMFDETGDSSRSHGLPRDLMQAQADALGIALDIELANWREYEATFVTRLQAMRAEGITHGLFGDIDLQPHRDWEEKVCTAAGMTAVLPLWQRERCIRRARPHRCSGHRRTELRSRGGGELLRHRHRVVRLFRLWLSRAHRAHHAFAGRRSADVGLACAVPRESAARGARHLRASESPRSACSPTSSDAAPCS